MHAKHLRTSIKVPYEQGTNAAKLYPSLYQERQEANPEVDTSANIQLDDDSSDKKDIKEDVSRQIAAKLSLQKRPINSLGMING